MRRMQVVIEEWQYQYLQAKAAREGKTVSALLREIITDLTRTRPERDPLLEAGGIAGAADERRENLFSETIDRRLYGGR
ncbi:MAG: hypothetical protein HPY90_15560 [Syntrophothermus sp.]|uniref:hypothetical protein n=1 Tax=Syntrophothermus sp. TaxID=2736299 RepID=UPI00257F13F6|nr:hypothetical protein [Syntrophothermus sp.]NSW84611.1 hypothetical protein [Syntrophothermus sp.]